MTCANLAAKRRKAEGAVIDATERSTGAWHRLDHLAKLHNDLADTLRELDEAEASSDLSSTWPGS